MKLKSFKCPDTGLIYEFVPLAEAYIAQNEDEEVFVMSEDEFKEKLDEGQIDFKEEDILAEAKDEEDLDGDEEDDKEGTSDDDSVDESDDEDDDDEDKEEMEESDDEDDDDDDDEEMEESLELDFEVTLSEADQKALFENGLISEEYADTAKTIFETAIKEKVQEQTEVVIEHYNKLTEAKVEKNKKELTENVNKYLDYVIGEWMKENEIAIESSLKIEMNEEFISKLSEAFEGHFIKIPDERYDILEGLADKVETLETQLDEQLDKNSEQQATIKEMKLEKEVTKLCEGLSANQSEKFRSLVENISSDDIEEFKTKATQLKESYFKSSGSSPDSKDNNLNQDNFTPVNENKPLSWIERASQI